MSNSHVIVFVSLLVVYEQARVGVVNVRASCRKVESSESEAS